MVLIPTIKSGATVLATSADNVVTARTMSLINYNSDLYFQTDKKMNKYRQLTKNSNVALCNHKFQLEGMAIELGHPADQGNEFFYTEYQRTFPSSFERYKNLKDQVLIKIKLKKMTIWKYINSIPHRDFIDLENQTAFREEYKG